MQIYEYREHKQGIYKCIDGTFEVVTLGNGITKLNKFEVICYLCADRATSLEQIKANICKFYSYITEPVSEIRFVIDSLVKKGLLVLSEMKQDLHKHVSFNKNILNQLDIEVDKRTILSIADIELAVTDKCPFHCSYCSKKENIRNQTNVTLEEWKKVIDDAYQIGANGIKLTGGEPLHPQVIDKTLELARHAKDKGYERIVLLTSGYSLGDHIRKIVEAGITEISISYNMISKNSEDRIRNHYVEENFDTYLLLKEYNIRINICCVVNQESILLIESVLQFAIDKSVSCIHFFPVMPVGSAKNNWDNNKLYVDELKDKMKYLKAKRNELKDVICISAEQMYLSLSDTVSLGCEALNYWLYISEDGYVGTCACAELSSNNIKYEKIINIWRNAPYFENLRSFEDDPGCNQCSERKYCINNCYIRILQKNKEFLVYENSDCIYKK